MTVPAAVPAATARPAADVVRVVVPRYGEAVIGGAESAMRRLGHALSARGWEVEVWTTTALDEATWSSGFAPGLERDGDVVVRRFPVALRRRPWLFRQLSRAAYHLPRGIRAEHLWSIAQGPYSPALVGALARADPVPTIFSPYLFHTTTSGLPAASHPRILVPAAHDEPALRLALVGRALRSADALWFHSPEERDLVGMLHPQTRGLPSACGVVGVEVPGTVDRHAFAARHGITGPYIYHGGRIAGGKGLELLSAAAELLHASNPAATAVLSGEAGTGMSTPWLHRVGRLGEAERWEAMAGAAAIVVPGRLESLSLLALEAWALGRPCLLNAGSPVLAGHAARGGGGLTFTDARDLAERAGVLIDNPDRAAAMGAAGRAHVAATYRWDLAEHRLRTLLAASLR
ncbi:MAG: glycosyltransferase [Candidatus Dormibacteria bacterium]